MKRLRAVAVLADPDLSQYSTKSILGFAQLFPELA